MEYTYINKINPDLDALKTSILTSSIASIYSYLRWDQIPDNTLTVILNRELNSEEKTLLDNLIVQI